MRFGAKASQQEKRDAARDLHRKRAFRNGNRDQGRNSPDGLDRPKRASSPCQLRNRRISQKADDACAKDHRLGAHNPFGADKQADPAIEEKLASQESDCLSTENTALLAVQMIGPAIDSTNAYVPRRLKVASGALLLREGGRGIRMWGEAFGCGLIGFLYCSIASLTDSVSFTRSSASGWDRALSKFSIMASMLGIWSGCSFIFT